jgi:hypothetical protein
MDIFSTYIACVNVSALNVFVCNGKLPCEFLRQRMVSSLSAKKLLLNHEEAEKTYGNSKNWLIRFRLAEGIQIKQ